MDWNFLYECFKLAVLILPVLFGLWFFCIVYVGAMKDAQGE